MNIINALTLRHLKLNKKRTMVTIIGVILSVAMITAIPTCVISFVNMVRRSCIEDTGNWHVVYENMKSKNIDTVNNEKNTAKSGLNRNIGYAKLEGSRNKNKPYIFIKEYDEQGFESFNIKLVQGRLPKNSNEIVISSHIIENAGVKYKVGDVLKLEVGERQVYENGNVSILGQDSSFVNEIKHNNTEKLSVKFTKEYTVTGIINKPNFESYWSPGYTVVSYLDRKELTPKDTVNMSVIWKSVSKKANEHANKLAGKIGVPSESVKYNSELLRYHGIMNDGLLLTLYILAGIMVTIIIIGSIALIYNSFAISISERSRHLGMLASVGATKKQKSKSVFFEGFVVGSIGIPIGVILGIAAMGVTFKLVQPLIEGFRTKLQLKLVISPMAILVAVLLSVITILISAYIPAKRASKVSPIDALRQSKDIKLTSKAVKTSKLTRRIFGFEAELGLKNLKRNRRRYRCTIFSLVISIVIFLSVSSLALFARKSSEITSDNIFYDLCVSVNSSATVEEKKDFYKEIAKMKYADESIIEQRMYSAEIDAESNLIPDEIKKVIEPSYKEKNIKNYKIHTEIQAIDDAALERYAKEIGVDVARLKDKSNPRGILINAVDIKIGDKYSRIKHFNIDAGEKLKISYKNESKKKEYTTDLEIAALADKTPVSTTKFINLTTAIFIVSEDVYGVIEDKFSERGNSWVEMFIKSSNTESLVNSINEYQNKTSIASVNIYDAAKQVKHDKQRTIFISVFFYGFVAIITLICVSNIFNTISTNVSLRAREFAMLKSVGMTPKGFNKMINYESLFYGIKALLYGLPISFLNMYLIFGVLSNSFTMSFLVPWSSVIIAIIAVFVIVTSSMLYASSKVKKENIIDALKRE